ncbi:MAG: UvrD/REP helicase, helicase / ATP-dependent helicase PcrA [Parcubacteria group bacterium]|nr:UvrD/REP helicase, helicase / ATP-dependent helicase PcrA [Parcubacteria group bacterium]
MKTSKFEELYKKLNPRQKEAVDAIEGPVMVIAGPGTGKTSILTLRIANILAKTDTTPDSILALTFTESGVHSMRQKLADIIGSAAYKVSINTFHGFANEMIKNYPEEFPRIIGSNNATDIDQIKILEEIISSAKLQKLKPYGDTFYHIRPIISEIRNLKRENVGPENLAEIIKEQEKNFSNIEDLYHKSGKYSGEMKGKYKDIEKSIEKNKELLIIYKKYEKSLMEKRLYDYEDMILEAIKSLTRDKGILLELQEKYQYILADEHQDANSAQNKMLELISGFHENPNLFVVGDEKQAIFRFQGASLDNFLYFKNIYPEALIVRLDDNYRSTQTILDASHSLIGKNFLKDESLRVKLKANAGHKNIALSLYPFSKFRYEMDFLADDIQKKIQDGVNPNEIAVLHRENKDASNISRPLAKAGIPFAIESDENLFSDEEILKLLIIARSLNDLNNDEFLARVLCFDFLNIDYLDVLKILRYNASKKSRLIDVLRSAAKLKEAGAEQSEKIILIFNNLLKWSRLSQNKNILDFFETVIRDSGFLNHLLSLRNSAEKLARLDTLFEEIKKLAQNHKDYRLSDFVNYLDILDNHGISIKSHSKKAGNKGVRIMTAHKSKGLEYEYVYIVGATDGHWGNKREIRNFKIPMSGESVPAGAHIDDERRLFYVAMTRAKKEAAITYSLEGENGEKLLPSQFIGEIDGSYLNVADTKDMEEKYSRQKESAFSEAKSAGADIKDKEYLKKIFFEQGLSVTAINNYIDCPWNYFFNNLIRLPKSQSKHQMYGTAVHAALRHFFDKYKNEEDMSRKEFLILFKNYLMKQPLSDIDFEESLEKGEKSLGGYYDFYKGKWKRSIINEFNIGGVFLPINKLEDGEDSILLKGKLDKLEIDEDGNVNVVDYKTSKPKSRNEIEGKTKNSKGDYKRQLVFYKLLLDNYEKGKYKMTTGEIDFTEPDDAGKYHKEKINISDEDTQTLAEDIKKIVKEIATFSFWDKKCDDRKCEYCQLRGMMGLV